MSEKLLVIGFFGKIQFNDILKIFPAKFPQQVRFTDLSCADKYQWLKINIFQPYIQCIFKKSLHIILFLSELNILKIYDFRYLTHLKYRKIFCKGTAFS